MYYFRGVSAVGSARRWQRRGQGFESPTLHKFNICRLVKKKMSKVFNKIIEEFKNFSQVEAIALGGSRASKNNDTNSDIDIEIFVKEEIPIEKRINLIKNYSTNYEIGREYFGPGDEFFVDKMNEQLDVAYFRTKWIEEDFKKTFKSFEAKNGYTTCFLFTIKNCEIIYDKNDWLKDLKEKISAPYPEILKIIKLKRSLKQKNNG